MTPCGARKRDGTPCAQPIIPGGKRCHYHGGKSPQAMAAAKRNLTEQKARATAAALITRLDGTVDGDPLAHLVRMVTVAATAEAAYAELLREEGDVLDRVSYGVQGTRLEPHPLLKLWNEERDRLARFSKLALDAGVAQRQLRIAEGAAQVTVEVMFALIDHLNLEGSARDDARRFAADQLRQRVISATARPSEAP